MNKKILQNLIFKMVQLQSSRSVDQEENIELISEEKISTGDSTDDLEVVIGKDIEEPQKKEEVDVSSGTKLDTTSKLEKDLRTANIEKEKQAAIGSKRRQTWEDEFKKDMAELDTERQKQAITNQQKYGSLVMLVFILWLSFVGSIVAFQAIVLYDSGKVLSSWTLSVLIASPSGILIVVFRILFPPSENSRRLRKSRKK